MSYKISFLVLLQLCSIFHVEISFRADHELENVLLGIISLAREAEASVSAVAERASELNAFSVNEMYKRESDTERLIYIH